ncbi:hypothetical protein LY76DRAFT_594027 [Colletotrichum caudatum]|nr:hypothetical protein LY76DRAFT_594027 [Colletotrichum caudatum]
MYHLGVLVAVVAAAAAAAAASSSSCLRPPITTHRPGPHPSFQCHSSLLIYIS